MTNRTKDLRLAIIGLGYVGLPLALEFIKKRKVIGYDKNKKRVHDLNLGVDKNLEFTKSELKNSKKLKITNNIKHLKSANCYIVTVPTPVDKFNNPDLKHLLIASKMIGKMLKKKDSTEF